jgi:hypothetical protein
MPHFRIFSERNHHFPHGLLGQGLLALILRSSKILWIFDLKPLQICPFSFEYVLA